MAKVAGITQGSLVGFIVTNLTLPSRAVEFGGQRSSWFIAAQFSPVPVEQSAVAHHHCL